MSKQEDQREFTEEAASYGHTTRNNEQIPVLEDGKCSAEGMDKVDPETADSDEQLGNETFGGQI